MRESFESYVTLLVLAAEQGQKYLDGDGTKEQRKQRRAADRIEKRLSAIRESTLGSMAWKPKFREAVLDHPHFYVENLYGDAGAAYNICDAW